MKDITIIIPHYNSVTLLTKLLDSIPNKDNIEVIVVDDKSEGESIKSLERLMSNPKFVNVQFYKNETVDKGAGVCRNIALKKATGKWIMFSDADDFYLDSFYENIQDYIDSHYDLIYFAPTSVYIETGETSTRHIQYEKLVNNYLENKNEITETQLRYHFTGPWSKLIKHDLIIKNKIKFDEIIAANDVMFSVKTSYYAKKIHASNASIYCLTRNKGSLTMNLSEEVFDARINVHINYCNFIKKNVEPRLIKHLDMIGLRSLVNAYRNKLGIKKIFASYILFKKNKVKILDTRFLNPIFVIKKIKKYIKRYRNERKYYVN